MEDLCKKQAETIKLLTDIILTNSKQEYIKSIKHICITIITSFTILICFFCYMYFTSDYSEEIRAKNTTEPSGQYSDYEIYLDASQHGSDVNVWKDLSGKGNDVTLNGFTHDGSTNGWINNSLVFNGSITYGLCNTFKPFSTSAVASNGVQINSRGTVLYDNDYVYKSTNTGTLGSTITESNGIYTCGTVTMKRCLPLGKFRFE